MKTLISLIAVSLITASLIPATSHAGLTVNGTANGTWANNATMSYDATATDPTTVAPPYYSTPASLVGGSLVQTGGALTVNPTDWWSQLGVGINGAGTDTLSGGTQVWKSDGGAFFVGYAGTATLNISGGTLSSNAPDAHIGQASTATVNLTGGLLSLSATTFEMSDNWSWGTAHLTFGAGSGVLALTSSNVALTFYDGGNGNPTYFNFLTGSRGQLQIAGWSQAQFNALVSSSNIRVNGTAATAGQFAYASVGGTGIYSLNYNQTWAANVNYNWDTATANWSGAAWTNGDDALFGGTGVGTVSLGSGITANSLTFNTAGYTISGGALTLTGAASVMTNDSWAWISSVISGSNGLVISGTGTLYLTGANTYTGATAINASTLYVNGSTATLGSGSSAVTLANAAGAQLETFWWNGSANVGTSFSIGSLAGGGALGGNMLIGPTATLTVGTDNSSTTYAGCISGISGWGSGGLTKTGTGTLTLTGTSTYTGTTTISGGNLQLGDGTTGHDGSFASPGIVNNASLVFNLSGTQAYVGTISGSGTTTLKAGTLSVTGTIGIAGTFAPKAGSTLNFCLGGVGASGMIQLTGSYAAPASAVGITITDVNYTLGSGTYNLITGAPGISAGSFAVNSAPAGYACTLSASNGTLALAVVASSSSPTMVQGADGTSGSAFSYQIALVNNPTGFGASGLPAGLSLNAGTGVISGTVATPGTYFATISSSCAAGSASSQLIIVMPPPPGTPLLTGSNSPQVVFDSGTSLTLQPYLDNTLLINPGKGYVDYDPAPTSADAALTDQFMGLGFERVNWCDIEPTEGNIQWSVLDSLISAYAQHGLKVSFGVINTNPSTTYATPQWVFQSGSNPVTHTVYPAGATPMTVNNPIYSSPAQIVVPSSWSDPVYLARMQEFIAAFGAHYNGNPNIAEIQMLNYGLWGERNGVFAAGMTAATNDNLANNYWNPYFQAFPNTQVSVSNYDAFSLSKGAGTFICYIMSGTFAGVSNASSILSFYPSHPIRMEYYGGCQQYYRGSALDELLIWITSGRPSYIPFDGDIYAANPNASQMVGNLVGYHFVIQQAVIPKTITANVSYPLSFTWYNDGVAPLTLSGTAPCNVAVALLDANNNPVQKQWLTSSNPKGWMPGVPTTENFNVSFPSVPTGYKLAVGLFASQSDANPAYKLGIQGRTNNGWYILSGTVAQAAATWTNTSGGSWQTGGNWTGCNFNNGIDAVADFSTLNLTADATVTLDGNVTAGSVVLGDTTPSNNWILNTGTGGALTLRTRFGSPVVTVNNQTATLNAVVIDNNGFTKNGSGTLAISNTNDAIYGNITVNGGVLDITNGQLYNNYGGTAVLTVNSGATLRLATWGSWYVGENLGLLSGSASSVVVNGGTIDLGVASSDYNSRNFTIGALGATLSVSQAGGFWDLGAGAGSLANPSSLTLTGSGGGEIDMAITGTGSLTKNGSGGWYLTGSNSYSGATAINGGLIYLNSAAVTLGSGSSAVTLANVAGATLQTFWWNGTTNIGTSFSIGSLAGGGALGGNVVLGQTATMTVGKDNTSTTYAGVISDLWGPGNVTKVGTGTWTLTGANTYTGATTVSAGKIVLNGTIASTASVSIAAGAQVTVTGKLYATGNITNSGTMIFSGTSPQFGAGGTITNNGVIINNSPSLTLPTIVNNGTILSVPPSPWVRADIGTVGITGSATYLTGTYTVMGGGAGITSSSDAFCYTYQTSSSDCSVVARVASITNTNASAKGGVMIRNTTAANSMEAGVWVTPSSGIIFTYRTTTGGTTTTSSSTGKTAPYWVKITRTGNSFAGYYSTNGTSWTQLGSTQTISMGTSATIGLGVTSNVAGTLCTSKIDNVTATP
jgi:autotransporter-associated beta strand protein